jgi:hypothetical protein
LNLANVEAVKGVVGHAHSIERDVMNVTRLVIDKVVVEFHARVIDRVGRAQLQCPKQAMLHEQVEGIVYGRDRDGPQPLPGLKEHLIRRWVGGGVEHKLPDGNPLIGGGDARLAEDV